MQIRIPRRAPGRIAAPSSSPQVVVQRQAAGDTGHRLESATALRIDELGVGAPLDESVRARMERGFGRDFSAVRVHTGVEAEERAERLGADALAVGEHVAFASGRHRPDEPEGEHLLAHELGHVLQQRGARAPIDRTRSIAVEESPAHERDADRLAQAAVSRLDSGSPLPAPPLAASAPGVHLAKRTSGGKGKDKDIRKKAKRAPRRKTKLFGRRVPFRTSSRARFARRFRRRHGMTSGVNVATVKMPGQHHEHRYVTAASVPATTGSANHGHSEQRLQPFAAGATSLYTEREPCGQGAGMANCRDNAMAAMSLGPGETTFSLPYSSPHDFAGPAAAGQAAAKAEHEQTTRTLTSAARALDSESDTDAEASSEDDYSDYEVDSAGKLKSVSSKEKPKKKKKK